MFKYTNDVFIKLTLLWYNTSKTQVRLSDHYGDVAEAARRLKWPKICLYIH